MKLYGATRVRNEEEILEATLDHVAEFCEKIFVFDDASTDATVDICRAHPAVEEIYKNPEWSSVPSERKKLEGIGRTIPYGMAIEAGGADYVYMFDADEHAEITSFDFTHDCHPLRLFAYYITPDDEDKDWRARTWIGPEYLDIPMLWKARPRRFFERASTSVPADCGPVKGYVKHYGKAISVEQWQADCDYYANNRWDGINDRLRDRWQNRKGKAVHTLSDFGAPLIKWAERNGRKITKLTQ